MKDWNGCLLTQSHRPLRGNVTSTSGSRVPRSSPADDATHSATKKIEDVAKMYGVERGLSMRFWMNPTVGAKTVGELLSANNTAKLDRQSLWSVAFRLDLACDTSFALNYTLGNRRLSFGCVQVSSFHSSCFIHSHHQTRVFK